MAWTGRGIDVEREVLIAFDLLLAVVLGLFLYTGFLRGDVPFARLGAWQTSYLYVLAAWAAVVALLFPPLFGFA